MKRGCPNSDCKNPTFVVKDGFYFRKNDSRRIARFLCRSCGRKFSAAPFSDAYRQKKRRVNVLLFKLIASGVSMRRSALLLQIHRTTVKRKLIYLAEKARLEQRALLSQLALKKVEQVQFDDLITSHQSHLRYIARQRELLISPNVVLEKIRIC